MNPRTQSSKRITINFIREFNELKENTSVQLKFGHKFSIISTERLGDKSQEKCQFTHRAKNPKKKKLGQNKHTKARRKPQQKLGTKPGGKF